MSGRLIERRITNRCQALPQARRRRLSCSFQCIAFLRSWLDPPVVLIHGLQIRHGTPLRCRLLSTLGRCGNDDIDPRVFRSGRLGSRERRDNSGDFRNERRQGLPDRARPAPLRFSDVSASLWETSMTGYGSSLSLPLPFLTRQVEWAVHQHHNSVRIVQVMSWR